MKKFWVLALCAVLCWGMTAVPSHAAALTSGTVYTITIQKMNSNGTVSDFSTTEATADANGKLIFSLTSMPTNADCNFIVFIVKDANQVVQRKGFVPAPPAGYTNQLGINNLSTAQTNAILSAAEKIGTDDPIPFAYLITLLRSDGATENDALTFADMGKVAIVGTGGFEDTLTTSGVTAAQLANFKSYLIYNPTAGKKTLRDLTASFKAAVDSGDATTAKQELQKAGGFMADVFMDAASSAGIDYTLILVAHDAAGVVCEAHNEIVSQLSTNVQSSMNQSMSAFFQRIAAIKVKGEYTKALNTLEASGTQVDTFNNAVNAMMDAMAAIDSDYADLFNDPAGYCTAHGKDFATVQQEVDARYQAAFAAFQTAIAASNADITAMKTNVATAFAIDPAWLPGDFGKYVDFTGTQKNWPIPQVVMVNWMAAKVITTGGSLTYTRDTLTIPTQMQQWMGSCSDPTQFFKTACEATPGATWTAGRRDYINPPMATPSASFNAYLGLMEDIQIIENARYAIYSGGGNPTHEQEKANKLTFQERMGDAADRIGGTTNGTTAITDAQKDAIIKLLMQPSMD
ncbi:MAG: hypothetical protein NTX30_03770 [Deltaproteobacteria bacterium]|jgi:hypothetical protein|nr:hypothetical protein [Deltaproteobacteria bacterium]